MSPNSKASIPTYFVVPRDSRPIGYSALFVRHQLRCLPHHRWSFIATRGERRELDGGRHVLRLPQDPDEMSNVEHLLFSLKHDGINLAILAALFTSVPRTRFESELAAAVRETPTGQYHRRLWYLYEWLTGRELPIEEPPTSSYIDLLDGDDFYTGRERKSPRHRVIDNLPGNREFCPLVRRTEELARHSSDMLRATITILVSQYDPDLFARALAFIYTKETRSSFAIEHEQPNASRAERFANILKRAANLGDLSEQTLTEIQNRIVDPRFAEDGFRTVQNYVGESIGLHRQIVHFVPPKPKDVADLMTGLLRAIAEHAGHVPDPVVWAACISFGFVFVHPFVDGNGRLHRFLIHYMLAREQVTTNGMIIPVSAVMLAKRAEYDRCLERFSSVLVPLVDYDLDDEGALTVSNDTVRHYRYFDATPMAEALYRWLEEAVDVELRGELTFLLGLRKAKAGMQEIVDLPDQLADLFVKIVAGNGGKLSKRKRELFAMLSNDEIGALEEIVRTHMVPAAK